MVLVEQTISQADIMCGLVLLTPLLLIGVLLTGLLLVACMMMRSHDGAF